MAEKMEIDARSNTNHGRHWKGGRSIASNGYVLVWVGPEHHLADVRGYAYEHRVMAESKLGRRLKAGEVIHHINGNKQDNRKENLEVCRDGATHRLRHRKPDSRLRLPGEENPAIQCACGCGGIFLRFDGGNRPRRFISGHNPQDNPLARQMIAACGDGSKLNDIAANTGRTLRAVKVMASKLVRQQLLVRKGGGVYGRAH